MCCLISAGDVVVARFPYSNPPKNKFCICICPNELLFLVINSKFYRFAGADSQIRIFKEELNLLEYDSYIDTSKAYCLDVCIVQKGLENGVSSLSVKTRERIKFHVKSQGYLPEYQKKLVLENL